MGLGLTIWGLRFRIWGLGLMASNSLLGLHEFEMLWIVLKMRAVLDCLLRAPTLDPQDLVTTILLIRLISTPQ